MTSPGLLASQATATGDGLSRIVTVTPGMCGGNLFISRAGDWTWEAVGAACDMDVLTARTAEGRPAYLSFYYNRVRGSDLRPDAMTFGDRLTVTSRVFGLGGRSVITLHRLSAPDGPAADLPLEPAEVYEAPDPGCLYVETVNRWISRTRDGSNEDLAETAPVGFRSGHLSSLPAHYSPRAAARTARKQGVFDEQELAGYTRGAPDFRMSYALSPVRDLNGVGLVYFASYYAIVDTALLHLAERLGRDATAFLRRSTTDHRLGFFGNADPDARLAIGVRLWRAEHDPHDEIADVTIRDEHAGRLIAVARIRMRYAEEQR